MTKKLNTNALLWALIAVLAVVCVFVWVRPSGKDGGVDKVAIAEGHSAPIDIEPVEGIRITAPENALDKDREFKISPVSDKVWDKATEKVKQAAPWETPLLCFDLDAGMKPDQQMPGYFQVSLDLNKLGVPRSLHDKLTVWRNNGDQTYQYTSWVENGKLYFNSDQNCSIILAFAVGVPFLCSVMWTTSTIGKHKDVLRMYKYFFFKEDDLVMQEVKDKYGNFELYFRYKDTEWADRFDSYKNHSYLYKKELEKLEAETEEIYSKRVDKQYRGELADMNRLQQLYNSRAAYNRAKEAVDRAFILDSLSTKDEDLQLPAVEERLNSRIQQEQERFQQAAEKQRREEAEAAAAAERARKEAEAEQARQEAEARAAEEAQAAAPVARVARFCPNCGTPYKSETSKFCSACGTPR